MDETQDYIREEFERGYNLGFEKGFEAGRNASEMLKPARTKSVSAVDTPQGEGPPANIFPGGGLLDSFDMRSGPFEGKPVDSGNIKKLCGGDVFYSRGTKYEIPCTTELRGVNVDYTQLRTLSDKHDL